MTNSPRFPRRLNTAEHDCLLKLLHTRFPADAGTWQPLWLNGKPLGRLNSTWLARVQNDWPERSEERHNGFHLYTDNWLTMGDSLQHMAHHWHKTGLLSGWRNEKFDVEDSAGTPLFALERAAFRPLGLMSHAVHINGLTEHNGEWLFWIGRRSPHKAVDPDKLDNLVGGGIASGESIHQAMMREGHEEAGLPASLLQHLACKNRRLSVRPVARGLHNEMLHIFDVILPQSTHPENQDGEVAEFKLMNPAELTAAMCSGQMMNDAVLATLDAFSRYGLLEADHSLTRWLADTRSP